VSGKLDSKRIARAATPPGPAGNVRAPLRQFTARHHFGKDQPSPASLGEIAERLIADTGHGSEQNMIAQPQMADRYAHNLGTNQLWVFFMHLSNRNNAVK
jgi:hypothetical protein